MRVDLLRIGITPRQPLASGVEGSLMFRNGMDLHSVTDSVHLVAALANFPATMDFRGVNNRIDCEPWQRGVTLARRNPPGKRTWRWISVHPD